VRHDKGGARAGDFCFALLCVAACSRLNERVAPEINCTQDADARACSNNILAECRNGAPVYDFCEDDGMVCREIDGVPQCATPGNVDASTPGNVDASTQGKADASRVDGGPSADAGCVPDCAGKYCGADACGGDCGTCSVGSCTGEGQCLFETEDFEDISDWTNTTSSTEAWVVDAAGYIGSCALSDVGGFGFGDQLTRSYDFPTPVTVRLWASKGIGDFIVITFKVDDAPAWSWGSDFSEYDWTQLEATAPAGAHTISIETDLAGDARIDAMEIFSTP